MSHKGVTVDPERTQAIQDFPPPRDAKGAVSYTHLDVYKRQVLSMTAVLITIPIKYSLVVNRIQLGQHRSASVESNKTIYTG